MKVLISEDIAERVNEMLNEHISLFAETFNVTQQSNNLNPNRWRRKRQSTERKKIVYEIKDGKHKYEFYLVEQSKGFFILEITPKNEERIGGKSFTLISTIGKLIKLIMFDLKGSDKINSIIFKPKGFDFYDVNPIIMKMYRKKGLKINKKNRAGLFLKILEKFVPGAIVTKSGLAVTIKKKENNENINNN